MITDPRTPGQAGYERVYETALGIGHDGRPLPTWDQLPDEGREVWEVAADGVREFFADPRRDTIPVGEPSFDPDEVPTLVDVPHPPTARVPLLSAEELLSIVVSSEPSTR